MCTETIALCDSCGFHRHMHYHLCMAWIWSFRQIKWTFTTPLSSTPKAKNCPFLDGEVKHEIGPGLCPNAQCPGHKLKAERDAKAGASRTADTRTDEEKIEAQRIKMGLKKRIAPTQGFRDPLEVGRPHQNKIPVVITDGRPDEGVGPVRGRERRAEQQGQKEKEYEGAIAIQLPSPTAQAPVRRQRDYNGPMMRPH
ncbi:hypothetical protein CORC01_03458 [Colletotrichum orchidophilum]|uniref:Uncharacterized protein n=1 Tax=Colletotrichum orchidophilum TaxID=1209926 RepID=A0A1G4BIA3_9PEZI|nr:uncharacterized protein CORC01_03458 [Colletotrichum orchidophilum]OHF01144.1 hypothetical protein CORC01_03458 [Colletotrichum orchidophilum]